MLRGAGHSCRSAVDRPRRSGQEAAMEAVVALYDAIKMWWQSAAQRAAKGKILSAVDSCRVRRGARLDVMRLQLLCVLCLPAAGGNPTRIFGTLMTLLLNPAFVGAGTK